MEKRYYFITYSAKRNGERQYWNQCIDESPIQFIIDQQRWPLEHHDWVVNNTLEITKAEFDEFDGQF